MIRGRRSRFLLIALTSVLVVFLYLGLPAPWSLRDEVPLRYLEHAPPPLLDTPQNPDLPSTDKVIQNTEPNPPSPARLSPAEQEEDKGIRPATETPLLTTSAETFTTTARTSLSTPATTSALTLAPLPAFLYPPNPAEGSRGPVYNNGEGRLDNNNDVIKPKPQEHWIKGVEHFPVPAIDIIPIPTGAPKKIPRIQHTFAPESGAAKAERLTRLKAIRSTFERSWAGYKKYAWLHDELRPVSASFKDPFCGWAATLVDSLDTLWIMGMTEEFEEAVNATAGIDFTTSPRADIPLFETTIRYLGGLLGAYDVSGAKYKTLLRKAVELAEVLMGAFDTPNRMPDMYYHWAPSYASQPHRAGLRVSLAEIASLSVEFTRLAQLTGEAKYYDAVARITDALDLFQPNTSIPGLWPLSIDASGCVKSTPHRSPGYSRPQGGPRPAGQGIPIKALGDAAYKTAPQGSGPGAAPPLADTPPNRNVPDPGKDASSFGADSVGGPLSPQAGMDHSYSDKDKNSFGDDAGQAPPARSPGQKRQVPAADSSHALAQCTPTGLQMPGNGSPQQYGFGSMADSAYEYFPKQWLLLGGLRDQYKTMHELALDAAFEHLLYRPMIKDNDREILFMGSYHTGGVRGPDGKLDGGLTATTGHLSCFLGGYVGMSARIFNRSGDLEIASKLTDGCVWAYESTATGLMPEEFTPLRCDNITACPWNEGRWQFTLDPDIEHRLGLKKAGLPTLEKRQTTNGMNPAITASLGLANIDNTATSTLNRVENSLGNIGTIQAPVDNAPLPMHTPLSHEEFAAQRVLMEGLTPGVEKVNDRRYILR